MGNEAPVLMPSLDISQSMRPTVYLDEEAILEDLSKTLVVFIVGKVLIEIIGKVNWNGKEGR